MSRKKANRFAQMYADEQSAGVRFLKDVGSPGDEDKVKVGQSGTDKHVELCLGDFEDGGEGRARCVDGGDA